MAVPEKYELSNIYIHTYTYTHTPDVPIHISLYT